VREAYKRFNGIDPKNLPAAAQAKIPGLREAHEAREKASKALEKANYMLENTSSDPELAKSKRNYDDALKHAQDFWVNSNKYMNAEARRLTLQSDSDEVNRKIRSAEMNIWDSRFTRLIRRSVGGLIGAAGGIVVYHGLASKPGAQIESNTFTVKRDPAAQAVDGDTGTELVAPGH
jgi:hypothetical protein